MSQKQQKVQIFGEGYILMKVSILIGYLTGVISFSIFKNVYTVFRSIKVRDVNLGFWESV